jgi:hypothetical protein
MQYVYDDPQYWRERADEARTTARLVSHRDMNAAMLRVAVEYDRMAHAAEQSLVQMQANQGRPLPGSATMA